MSQFSAHFHFWENYIPLMIYTIFGNTFHITLIYTVIRAQITLLLLQQTYQPVFWTEVPSSADAGSPDLHHRWTTAESWEIQIQTPHPHEQTPAWSHMAPPSGHHLLCTDSTETQSPVFNTCMWLVMVVICLWMLFRIFFVDSNPGPTCMLNLHKSCWLLCRYT